MSKPIILVIDDDRHQVELLETYLESQGYLVYTAFDGIHALPLAQARKPALIVMDVDMPMTNGLQALVKLREDPATQNIPVILLTGVVSAKVFPFVDKMPRVSHVKKPVNLEDLGSVVRHYIPESA